MSSRTETVSDLLFSMSEGRPHHSPGFGFGGRGDAENAFSIDLDSTVGAGKQKQAQPQSLFPQKKVVVNASRPSHASHNLGIRDEDSTLEAIVYRGHTSASIAPELHECAIMNLLL